MANQGSSLVIPMEEGSLVLLMEEGILGLLVMGTVLAYLFIFKIIKLIHSALFNYLYSLTNIFNQINFNIIS